MKKAFSMMSIMLSGAMVLAVVAPAPVSAVNDAIEKRSVTAYLFNKDDSKELECLFTSALPDVPYIDAADYLNVIYTTPYTESKNADGTVTVSCKDASMTIDAENDTIYFDVFESFVSQPTAANGTLFDVPYCLEGDSEYEGEVKNLTLDLGKYGLDLIENDGKAYFPLTTISDICAVTYNSAEYINGVIYFFHSVDIAGMQGTYFEDVMDYSIKTRTPENIRYTYNELCFVIDNFYGCPAKGRIASSIEEKGFDKTLDEFSDDTRTAKQLLVSDSMTDYLIGLCYIADDFFDGGHTMINLSPMVFYGRLQNTEIGQELMNEKSDTSRPHSKMLTDYLLRFLFNQMDTFSLPNKRSAELEKYELVKSWNEGSGSRFYKVGDTGVFVFDSFVNEAVYAFKWSLDYAAQNGIKRFVIDVSCNMGGSSAVILYMMAVITNNKYHDNKWSLRNLQTLTGNISSRTAELDLDLNGEINDLDKDVAYDFEFAVVTSKVSFSCGNLFPVLAKDEGIAILGERSGGGTCGLFVFTNPEGMSYTLSGYSKFINKNNEDIDSGAPLDYELTSKYVDSDGKEQTDYTKLYDYESMAALIDEFYASKEESSQVESSQDESSLNEPSKVEPSQEQPSQQPSEQQSPIPDPVPDADNVKTGDSTSVLMIIFFMVLAAGAFCAVTAKRKI